MVAAGTVVALTLLLLVAIVPRLLDNGTAKRPNVPAVPDPDRIAQLAAFEQEFANKFGYLMVYDFAITPEGQRDRIFEKWMEIAGLHVDKTISIEERLEKDLLNCRFVGDDKIIAGGIVKDVSKDDVEMIFVRSTGGKIDTLQRLESFYRARVKDKIHLRIDLAETPPEMQVFLQLNDAASPYRGDSLAFQDTWSQPGTYRLQFRLGLHSMSFSRLGVVSGPAFKPEVTSDAKENSDEITFAPPPALPRAKLSDAGTRDTDPSQVLIIVRRLKEDFTAAVEKAPTSGSAEK